MRFKIFIWVLLCIALFSNVSAINLNKYTMVALNLENNAIDSSGQNNFTVTGCTFNTTEVMHGAYSISCGGASHSISHPTFLDVPPTTATTITGWLYTGDGTSNQAFFGKASVSSGDTFYVRVKPDTGFVRTREGGTEDTTPFGTNFPLNEWVMITVSWDNTDSMRVWFNNESNAFCDGTCEYWIGGGTNNDFGFGNYISVNEWGWKGVMDTLRVLNITANQTIINQLWNNSAGCPLITDECYTGVIIPPPISSALNIIFKNESGAIKTIFDEGENFQILLNHSLESVPLDSDCNITLQNGIIEESENGNFDICTSGCDYSINTDTADFTGKNILGFEGINDTLHFNICHAQTPAGSVNASFSCDAGQVTQIISASEIPLCSVGTLFITIENNTCVNNANVSYSITNNNIFAQRKNISAFSFDREFSALKIKANLFDSVYNYNDTTFEYYKHGSNEITASCYFNSTYFNATSENIIIVNIPPIILHSGVLVDSTFYPLTNGTIMEYVGGVDYEFFISIQDDDLSNANHTLYCSNGTQLWTTSHIGFNNAHSIYANNFTDFICNPFVLTSIAVDTTGNLTKLSNNFNVTDTSNPQISGFTDFTQLQNTTVNRTISFIDENFFSYNMTCNNSYSSYIDGLNVQSYQFDVNFLMPSNDVYCSIELCDGHTLNELKKQWDIIRISENEIEFRIGYKNKKRFKLDVSETNITFEKKKDRIIFTIEDKSNSAYRDYVLYYQGGIHSYYFEDKKYKAWIVDPETKTWFDLNGLKDDYTIFKNNDTWEIRFTSSDKKIKFESIGELNCVNANMTITSTEIILTPIQEWLGSVMNPDSCKMNDIKDIMILFFVFTLLIVFLIWNYNTMNMPAIDFIVGIIMLIYGISLWSCGIALMLSIVSMGLMIIVYGMFWRD